MHTNYRSVAGVLLALLIGIALGSLIPGDRAVAQSAGSVAKYQLSSYSAEIGGSVHHGCYIIDSTTGRVWHAAKGSDTEMVSTKLP